jgi:hypothetical protein
MTCIDFNQFELKKEPWLISAGVGIAVFRKLIPLSVTREAYV